jgi:very-short-patch-repair endonuclease
VVLSHRTAGAHRGLLRTNQTRIDVTAPRGRHGAPGIRLHRSRSLDAQDTTTHQGIPITTVSRTLLDLAAIAREGELERALAQAERLRLYDHLAALDHVPYEPDFRWPSHGVIVELDGFETHGTRAAFKADRAKDAALTASGYKVLRFTYDDDPQLAIDRLRALLPSAGSRPRSGSPVR